MAYKSGGKPSPPKQGSNGIASYIMNKKVRSQFTCSITATGECYYMVGQRKLSERDFNLMFPLGAIYNGREKLDSRQI